MAAKRVDPLKAKAAKQKKIAIGLCAFLALVLFFQIPRTLKMLKGPQPVSSTAAATTPGTTTPGTTTPAPATAAGGVPAVPATGDPSLVPATGSQPAVLADSDVPVAASAGQLLTFERFSSKDPFAQQAEAKAQPAATTPPAAAPTPTVDPTVPQISTTPTIPVSPTTGGGITAPGSGGTSDPTASPVPTSPVPSAPVDPPAAATSISVNGAAEDVVVGASFPAASPVFVLVSTAKDGKSVQIGIAGGTYADGKDTIKLLVGKHLVLKNTADGSRFELVLHSVLGFAPPKTAAK